MNLGKESETREFKSSTSELKESMVSISAMLNKAGKGTVYFGVDDNGNVKGMEIGKRTMKDIANMISLTIKPTIYPIIEEKADDDKRYIEVSVSGTTGPYSYKGAYYIRVGDEDKLADNDLLRKLLSSSSDFLREKPSYQDQLSFSALFASLGALGKKPINNLSYYRHIGLVNSAGSFNYQAELMSDSSPVSIKVSTFQGRDKDIQIGRKECGKKPLFVALEEASSYVNSLNETRIFFPEGKTERKEETLFDYASFREAWVNAVVHNDWMTMIPPAIYIYDDRLEILSYGGLPLHLDQKSFFEGISHPVNPSLFNMFELLNIVEANGHGVKKIVSSYGEKAFSIQENLLIVTIPFSFTPSFAFRHEIPESLNGYGKILAYLSNEPYASYRDISIATGYSLKKTRIGIDKLIDLGKLERESPRGKWIVK